MLIGNDMSDETKRRKPESEQKKCAVTFWATEEQRAELDEAAGDIPLSVWARAELLKVARAKKGPPRRVRVEG